MKILMAASILMLAGCSTRYPVHRVETEINQLKTSCSVHGGVSSYTFLDGQSNSPIIGAQCMDEFYVGSTDPAAK